MSKNTILMGDPFFFSIKGGANPHTRNLLGIKKNVDRELALKQWHTLAETLIDYGVQIFVIPPLEDHPGLVYPANAGFMANIRQKAPLSEKVFYLSNLLPSRAGEQEHYREILTELGVDVDTVSKRFEGEADLFPVDNKYIFTYGRLKKQRFAFRLGFPPYKRIYGFRSDYSLLNELKGIMGQIKIVPLELINESYYHGDTILCSFGYEKENLLVYLEGLSKESQEICKKEFKEYLIPLSEDDAKIYSANSFQVIYKNQVFLFMPEGVSKKLTDEIKERGTIPVELNVSEFMKKGGGSIKCMIGDLGQFIDSGENLSENIKEFRRKHRYENYYKKF